MNLVFVKRDGTRAASAEVLRVNQGGSREQQFEPGDEQPMFVPDEDS